MSKISQSYPELFFSTWVGLIDEHLDGFLLMLIQHLCQESSRILAILQSNSFINTLNLLYITTFSLELGFVTYSVYEDNQSFLKWWKGIISKIGTYESLKIRMGVKSVKRFISLF